ncbi:hypothetical protein ACROYT_G010230 [Oculina patagonica]
MSIFHGSFSKRLLCLIVLFCVICLLYVFVVNKHGFRRVARGITNKNATSISLLPTQPKQEKCFPVQKILFLKTHKTGSSTMANIFFRYGDSRNLTFVLGRQTLLGWPNKFHITSPLRFFAEEPNILCSHARFNKKPMNWLFPKKTSKYITILRNPVDNFESVFNFAHLGKSFGLADNMDSLGKFLTKGVLFNHSRPNLMTYLARNPMMFDLGLSFEYFQNLTAVNEYIHFLDKEFDLVMIMDYFDESLVLMKRLLCWEIEDILYVKLNERLDKEKAASLSESVQENIKRWNKADVLLFNHFNRTFWRKVKNEGPSFYDDISAFRRRKKEIRQLCLTDEIRLQHAYHDKFVKGYSLRNDLTPSSKVLCENLVRVENSFLEYLRNKRTEKLRNAGLDQEVSVKKETGWNVAKDLQYKPVKTPIIDDTDFQTIFN